MDNAELGAEPTPRERLELTRKALAGQLARRRRPARAAAADPELAQQQGMLARVRRAGSVWWHSHPIHDAVDFARPALQDFAEHKPYKLVGIAASAGAVAALMRVWHVLPLTGVAFALMKSSDIKATVQSFAAAPSTQRPHADGVGTPRTAATQASSQRAAGA